MKTHLIAIGGAVMHNLALALLQNGHQVSGSDDEIYDPSRSRLQKAGLLPEEYGWFPEKITPDLDCVILGMHARPDNPELAKAQSLGIKVLSFPEFIFEHAKNKTRVVVAGSHGKTTTTSMIMHVLRETERDFDYLVGAQLEGFETMVRLSNAPLMVIEGDEYLSSPIDRRAKFLHYHPHIAIITGIAWDHINVFPTFEEYLQPFGKLLDTMEPEGNLIYFEQDENLRNTIKSSKSNIYATPYQAIEHKVVDNTALVTNSQGLNFPMKIFGGHNMANMSAAAHVCHLLGIDSDTFIEAMTTFAGAAKRLQVLVEKPEFAAWTDFAHAPSKVRATTKAVHQMHLDRKLVACVELHTFSSLNQKFLPQYRGALAPAETGCVFYSPHTVAMKKMEPIAAKDIEQAFDHPNLKVFTEREELEKFLRNQNWNRKNLLMMSSGTFGGMNLKRLSEELASTITTND